MRRADRLLNRAVMEDIQLGASVAVGAAKGLGRDKAGLTPRETSLGSTVWGRRVSAQPFTVAVRAAIAVVAVLGMCVAYLPPRVLSLLSAAPCCPSRSRSRAPPAPRAQDLPSRSRAKCIFSRTCVSPCSVMLAASLAEHYSPAEPDASHADVLDKLRAAMRSRIVERADGVPAPALTVAEVVAAATADAAEGGGAAAPGRTRRRRVTLPGARPHGSRPRPRTVVGSRSLSMTAKGCSESSC